ncbi:hypothetical protein [Glycomyces artemisiae]|uniref:Uncharacterized protein n=1 Tax=Glycomyces artemisiae TaxID=1076443 RepID=A0A2T0UKV3_9ACTN|nr:hypothetical protein [Glycomyces artemisiae]PRY58579.1 hypothetical protein B0I28_105292 [Glycomyces artemisiae]
MAAYIPGPNHMAANVKPALDRFWAALIKRWQKEAAESFLRQQDIRTGIVENADATLDWPYLKRPEVDLHRSECDYLSWGQGGDGAATPTSCKGRMPASAPPTMPASITCPLPQVMTAVHGWAKTERDAIEKKVPKFDAQELPALDAAYGALKGLYEVIAAAGPAPDGSRTAGAGSLSGRVADLSDGDGTSQNWWVEWTGLAADGFRSGFLQSTLPTLDNHRVLAVELAKLVNYRSGIIQMGRGDTLHLIDQAATALGATGTVQEGNPWVVLEGLGKVLAFTKGPAEVVGKVFDFIAFLGEELLPTHDAVRYTGDHRAIVTALSQHMDQLRDLIDAKEIAYRTGTGDLRSKLDAVGSFDLELYDLTENRATGTPAGDRKGFGANTTKLIELAEKIGLVAGAYEELPGRLAPVQAAAAHFADREGHATPPDEDVLAMVEEFRGFLSTTAARYYTARDQVAKAAEDYEESDKQVSKAFTDVLERFRSSEGGTRRPAEGFDTEAEAADTRRAATADDDPYTNAEGQVYETTEHLDSAA